jgi:hypothetical protein
MKTHFKKVCSLAAQTILSACFSPLLIKKNYFWTKAKPVLFFK